MKTSVNTVLTQVEHDGEVYLRRLLLHVEGPAIKRWYKFDGQSFQLVWNKDRRDKLEESYQQHILRGE